MKNKQLVLEALLEKKEQIAEHNVKVYDELAGMATTHCQLLKEEMDVTYRVVMDESRVRFLDKDSHEKFEILIDDRLRWGDEDKPMKLHERYKVKFSTYSLSLDFSEEYDREYGGNLFKVGSWLVNENNVNMIRKMIHSLVEYKKENKKDMYAIEREIREVEHSIKTDKINEVLKVGISHKLEAKVKLYINSRHSYKPKEIIIVKRNPKSFKIRFLMEGVNGKDWEEVETVKNDYALEIAKDILKFKSEEA